MKHRVQLIAIIAALFSMTFASKSVYADLNASEIFYSFNSMNGDQGFHFVYDTLGSPRHVALTTQAGYQNVDNSAYISGRGGSVGSPSQAYFQTFCVAPSLPAINEGLGKLNYDETTGHTATSQGYTLTLGAACLYKEYATNLTPLGVTENFDATGFTLAIRALMGIDIVSSWTQNIYLRTLLTMNSSKIYWTTPYQVNQQYSEIGDYCVFVMNVTDINSLGPYQDFLYIAPADAPSIVPESATFLLWSLGSMGLYGTSVACKRRRMKKTINS